jgi:hypothetical protein
MPQIYTLIATLLLTLLAALRAADSQPETFSVHEDFGPGFDAKKFLTPIPNKNTIIRDGVMWTRVRDLDRSGQGLTFGLPRASRGPQR